MRILSACIVSLIAWSGSAWGADQFPAIEGENLLGAKIALPEAAKGHPSVVVIGFSHASQAQTKTWSDRLDSEFKVYSIAMLQDVPRLVRPMAVGGIKSGVPQAQKDHYLLLFKSEKELKDAFAFGAPNDAYLALVAGDGTIRWRFHGPFSEESLKELKAQAASLDGH